MGTPPITVTPSAAANGSISPKTVQIINSGSSASFTATPSTGYGIYQWLLDGVVAQIGGTSYTTSDITANSTVEVTFQVIPVINSAATASGTYNTIFGGYTITASGSPTTFNETGVLPTGLTLDTTTGVISGTPTQTGNFPVTLSATNTAGTGTAPLTLTVNKAPQTISFPSIATQQYPGSSFTLNPSLNATASSALAVSYSYISGPATLSGTNNDTVTVTGVGTVVIQASQAGNGNYLAATSVNQSFTVAAPVGFTGNPTATPFNDGVPGLLKYFYDINSSGPMTAADRAALPAVGTTTNGATQYLTLTYRRYALATWITLSVQTSPDLQTWTTVPPDLSQQVGVDAMTGDPMMEVGVNTHGASKEFIRLNVTQP